MAANLFTGRLGAWLRRYGPAELLGTIAAFLGAGLAYEFSGSQMAMAVAANWAEALGYYGVIAVHDLWAGGRPTPRRALATLRALALEFGPAELLNLVIVRNAALYAGIAFAPSPALGLLAGKLVADVAFYLPAILSYELQRRAGLGRAEVSR